MTPPCRCHSAPSQPPCPACVSYRRPRLLPQPSPFFDFGAESTQAALTATALRAADAALTPRAMEQAAEFEAWLIPEGAK